MREDDRTGVSETRPDRQYRMPPCPIHSQFRVVGHDLGGRTHRTCPLSDFEPRSTWLKGATWEIPVRWPPSSLDQLSLQPDSTDSPSFTSRFCPALILRVTATKASRTAARSVEPKPRP